MPGDAVREAPAAGDLSPSRRRPWRRTRSTADGRAVLVLVAVPLAVFVVPALFGHPAIAGDNAIQNFPLRALSGDLLRQGHLPLWNPYLWSGTPLLGGLNAGSAYPLTFAFAVLPPVAAWVVNLLGTYWAAGLGLYVLLRRLGVRPLAGLLAALTYACSGAMSGQLVHLGVVEGMGWIPWMVLAQLGLSEVVLSGRPGAPTPGSADAWGPTMPIDGTPAVLSSPPGAPGGKPAQSPWPWVVLLAVSLGLIVLTGEPRAMAEAEVVASVVTLWLLLRPYRGRVVGLRRRVAFAGFSALAAAWGVVLAAVQIVPGWSFINASQRASESYAYFGSGSLRPAWTALLLVPDLFGGNGLLGQPRYFNSYNLAEVSGYVGLVPLVAASALLVRCFGRRRDPRAADWGLWLLLAGLGLLLAWGTKTPLGHLFVHIPLFGKTRLQSRNLGIVDLALAVLLGFWADRALGSRPETAGLAGRRRWMAAAPALAAGLLCVAAVAVPGPLEEAFGATAAGGALARSLTPWFLAELAVAVAVAALVLGWRRLGRPARRWWLAAVVVVDVVLSVTFTSVGLADAHAVLEPTTAGAAAVLGHTGRYAIYDTEGVAHTLDEIGQPDLNVFTKLPSTQGYGSILSGAYGAATGAHALDTLSPCALADGTFAQLRLASLLTLPTFVAPRVGASGPAPPPPPTCPGGPAPGTAGRRTFSLGQVVSVASVALAEKPGAPASARPLRLGVVGPDGRTTWPEESVRRRASGGWSVRLASPRPATGLVVTGPASSVAQTSVVTGRDGRRWTLDGVLQDALSTPGWRFAGTWHGYATFVATRVRPPVWVAAPAGGARVRRIRTTDWGSEVDRVAADRPVTVVRSEAYAAGWHVEAVPAGGGPSRVLPVERVGLVQGVRVPRGRWTLTFLYRPDGLDLGLAGSALGLAALLLAGAWGLVRRRNRSRRTRARAGAIAPAGAAGTAPEPVPEP